MAFRGTNFSRRTSSDPSRGGLEPYFAKAYPSVSIFPANKKYGADQDWVDFWDWATGGWPIARSPLGGQAAPSSPRKCAPRPHLGHFWSSFSLFWVIGLLLDFCPIVALLLPFLRLRPSLAVRDQGLMIFSKLSAFAAATLTSASQCFGNGQQ